MDAPDLTVLAFTVLNSVRVLAYVPQILRIAHDTDGAVAISPCTWAVFTLSHLTTVFYAVVVAKDPFMALMFAANTAGAGAIFTLTCIKRCQACHLARVKVLRDTVPALLTGQPVR